MKLIFYIQRPPRAQVVSLLRFLDHTLLDTHTLPVRLLCTSDPPVSQTTTYTTNTKDEHPCSQPVEPAVLNFKRPQSYVSDRVATAIGTC